MARVTRKKMVTGPRRGRRVTPISVAKITMSTAAASQPVKFFSVDEARAPERPHRPATGKDPPPRGVGRAWAVGAGERKRGPASFVHQPFDDVGKLLQFLSNLQKLAALRGTCHLGH